MHCRKILPSAQGLGAQHTFRPVAVASAPGRSTRPSRSYDHSSRRICVAGRMRSAHRWDRVAVRSFLYPVSDLDLPRLLPPVRSTRRRGMQKNGIPVADDYPYELQMKLFGNHLVSLAEEATRFDFRGVYTAAEVADILQVTPSKVYDLLHTKELPSIRIGKQFRIGKFTLWAYMNGLNHKELVEEILQRFVTQHCCRDGECSSQEADDDEGARRRSSRQTRRLLVLQIISGT